MTELSPQAQAVYDAYRKAAASPYYYEHDGLVAALRVVVQELKYFGVNEKNILAIAAELEGE
jgi:hypothetical protein